MTVHVDSALVEPAPPKRALASGRRFFRCEDGGISYSCVARNQAHAEKMIRDSGIDFPLCEQKDKDGNPGLDAIGAEPPTWTEITAERASEIRVHTEIPDHEGRWVSIVTPLDQCDMGDWFCSEW